jgi:trigger factor
MQVVRKDHDALNVTIEVTLEPVDYQAKLESELKKTRNNAHIKGFRKGQVPMATLKKMYGKGILSDIINDTLQDKLFNYLDEQDINYLGQPLPNRDQNIVNDLDVNDLKEYKFAFDLGLAPKLDLKGANETDQYDIYDVQLEDKVIDDEIKAARRRNGKRIEAEDTIQKMDMIKVSAKENNGDWTTNFTILVDSVKDEAVQKDLLVKKLNDTFTFDIYKLEDKEVSYVEKYLLNKPEDHEGIISGAFTGTITNVSRIEPADLDETFFESFGDPDVKDLDSLKALFRKDLKAYFDGQAKQFMYREIMERLMEDNKIDLPESFLKRYLAETNENISEEDIDKEFDAFAKNMKWSLQKSHLARKHEISVKEEDLRSHFTNSVFNYLRGYGNMDYSFVSGTVDRLMKDKDQVNKAYEEILADRIFDKIGETVKTKPISITQDEFTEKVKELNAKVKQ